MEPKYGLDEEGRIPPHRVSRYIFICIFKYFLNIPASSYILCPFQQNKKREEKVITPCPEAMFKVLKNHCSEWQGLLV